MTFFSSSPVSAESLAQFSDTLRQSHGVPAVSIGVLKENTIVTATSGVLSLEGAVAAPPDAMFQVASIGKVYTALLVWQLVDQGHLDPDAPLEEMIPDFRLTDASGRGEITARRLMAHTSGIDGDYLVSDNSGVARYVDRCCGVPLLFRPGTRWSYSNAGYVLLGHLVERLTGRSWQDLIETRLFKPLGLKRSLVNPFNLAAYPAAVGHLENTATGKLVLKQEGCFGESMRPAGSFMMQSVNDLMVLARTVLDGLGSDTPGAVLTQKSWKAMLKNEVGLPRHNPLTARGWSAGFTLFDDGSFGHAGGTPGYTSFLSIDPESRTAHAILVNAQSRQMRSFLRNSRDHLFLSLTQRRRPALSEIRETTNSDLAARISGTYRSASGTINLHPDDQHIWLTALSSEPEQPPLNLKLREIDERAFASFDPASGERGANITFEGDIESEDDFWLMFAGRAFRRAAHPLSAR